jgi:hypothetical protein
MHSSHEPSSMLFGALVSRPTAAVAGPQDLDVGTRRPLRAAALTVLGVSLLSLLAAALA